MIVSVLPVHLCCPGISVSHYHRCCCCCGPDLGLYIVSVVALLTSSLQFFDQWLHCGCWNRCGNPLSIKLVRLYTNADLLLFICNSGLVFCRLRLWWNGEEVPWDSGCEIWWRRTASRVQVCYCLSHCTVCKLACYHRLLVALYSCKLACYRRLLVALYSCKLACYRRLLVTLYSCKLACYW